MVAGVLGTPCVHFAKKRGHLVFFILPENTGICISGIRPFCGGVNLPKWTSFYKFWSKSCTTPVKKKIFEEKKTPKCPRFLEFQTPPPLPKNPPVLYDFSKRTKKDEKGQKRTKKDEKGHW